MRAKRIWKRTGDFNLMDLDIAAHCAKRNAVDRATRGQLPQTVADRRAGAAAPRAG